MKIVFLCGHESDYGACHIPPLLQSRFEVDTIVLASPMRWAHFRSTLEKGRTPLPQGRAGRQLRRRVASLLPEVLLRALGARGHRPVDVRRQAASAGVKIRVEDDVNSPEFLDWLKTTSVELVLSAAYPQIFNEGLINATNYGCVNFHPSLLPRFRGAYPHFWAIATGAGETGVTAHQMTKELDAGDLIAQRGFSVQDLDNLGLQTKLVETTALLVDDVASFYLDCQGELIAQDDSLATFYRQPGRDDVELHFSTMGAEQIINLCRTGLAGFTTDLGWIGMDRVRRVNSEVSPTSPEHAPVGTVLDPIDNCLTLALEDSVLVVERCSVNGKKVQWRRLLSKLNKKIGDPLTEPNSQSPRPESN